MKSIPASLYGPDDPIGPYRALYILAIFLLSTVWDPEKALLGPISLIVHYGAQTFINLSPSSVVPFGGQHFNFLTFLSDV